MALYKSNLYDSALNLQLVLQALFTPWHSFSSEIAGICSMLTFK